MIILLKKHVNLLFLLVCGLFFLALGTIALTSSERLFQLLVIVISYSFILIGLLELGIVFIKREKPNYIQQLIKTTINVFFGLFAINNIHFFIKTIIFCFGLYFLCLSILNLINCYVYKIANIKGKYRIYCEFILTLVLSLLLMFKPYQNISYAGIIIGIYCLGLGIIYISDYISEIMPKKTTEKIKRAIRIPLPILATLFIPHFLIKSINKMLQVDNNQDNFFVTKNDEKPDLFVIIHLANKGSAAFGHVEIAMDDKIYSFGNYDRHSRMLFDSIGDGIIAVANKREYMEYEVTVQNRYLIEFGLKLTRTQKQKAENVINKLLSENTIPYYPDLQLYEMGKIPYNNYHDISSDMYKLAQAKFYKITKGPHKKFFVCKTNCVMLAEYILGSLGKNVIAVNGIISPGTYYEYLNTEFRKKKTNVISRKIYTKDNIDTLE